MDRVLKQIIELENRGYQFEAAEASFELLVQRAAGTFQPHFKLLHYHVDVETTGDGLTTTEATVKLQVGEEVRHEVAEGDGPVNALDAAMRKALNGHFPNLRSVQLVDYKVRVINSEAGTAAAVRVVIESQDADGTTWGTVGVNENVIKASWDALVDSIEYKLCKGQSESTKEITMNTMRYDQRSNIESQDEAFEHWHSQQIHDHGTPISVHKAYVRAINTALVELLINPNVTVSAADIQSWTLMHLGFGEQVLKTERVNEHCLYEAGEPSTSTKRFSQPKKNPTLRVVAEGVYALAVGRDAYTYQTKSHSNK